MTMTWDFQDAIPSFERDDKQPDDIFRKTENAQKNTKPVGREQGGEMSGVGCVYAQVVHATLYIRNLSLSFSSCKVLLAIATYIYHAYTCIHS